VVAIIGLVVVFGSVLGGFMWAGGPVAVLIVWSEYLVIGGTALGTIIVATPGKVQINIVKKLLGVLKTNPFSKELYLDGMKLLYELFQLARRDGLAAIEGHIEQPHESKLFECYPKILANHHGIQFLCDSLRLVLMGSVPPYDLEAMMDAEIDIHHEQAGKAVEALNKVGDALPGIGIVAAVLGIVITMQSIAGPVEEIGEHVASALVGTFLGILLSYGVVQPLAGNIETFNQSEVRFYHFFKAGVVGFAKGFAPIISVEFARRSIFSDDRPSFDEMETACKTTKEKAA
jgi:chemotaxis protein MotA